MPFQAEVQPESIARKHIAFDMQAMVIRSAESSADFRVMASPTDTQAMYLHEKFVQSVLGILGRFDMEKLADAQGKETIRIRHTHPSVTTGHILQGTANGLAWGAVPTHDHNAADINAGTLAFERIPTGTSATQVAVGNHTHTGYLTSETDPTVPAHVKNITATEKSNWTAAHGWGDHALGGYLKSYTETDPTVPAHVKNITATEKSNWTAAHGWGDHASEIVRLDGRIDGRLAGEYQIAGTTFLRRDGQWVNPPSPLPSGTTDAILTYNGSAWVAQNTANLSGAIALQATGITNGIGVQAVASGSGTAVNAIGTTGTGVSAQATTGVALRATITGSGGDAIVTSATSGTGVRASSCVTGFRASNCATGVHISDNTAGNRPLLRLEQNYQGDATGGTQTIRIDNVWTPSTCGSEAGHLVVQVNGVNRKIKLYAQ
jgi:hypothetical protein